VYDPPITSSTPSPLASAIAGEVYQPVSQYELKQPPFCQSRAGGSMAMAGELRSARSSSPVPTPAGIRWPMRSLMRITYAKSR